VPTLIPRAGFDSLMHSILSLRNLLTMYTHQFEFCSVLREERGEEEQKGKEGLWPLIRDREQMDTAWRYDPYLSSVKRPRISSRREGK